MSDEAHTVLIVTDDPSFSALIAEQLLRVGVRTIRFAKIHEALQRTRHVMPDLILIHMPHSYLDIGWECYYMLQSDAALATVPILLYSSPRVLAERTVGAGTDRHAVDRIAVSDILTGQISPLLGAALSMCQRAETGPNEYTFPSGRDDL